MTAWLQSQGFQVTQVSKGRTVIEFSGTAALVQQAFHTSIHSYLVNGEQHYANASNPSIPAALAPVVAGVDALNSFPRSSQGQFAGIFRKGVKDAKVTPVSPQFTFPGGCDQNNNCYALGPYDFATIYNVLPLWNQGVKGTGETVAIVGRTNINIQDARDFRSLFGLTANDPHIILNGPDPGINGDESEADIDIQWSGAVAPNATIDFVTSASTESTDGVDLSALYIVDNNLAPVMSESYGQCELSLGTSGNQFYNQLWEQAAAQGITVFISSGDNGSAGCDRNQGTVPQPALNGLAVSGLASTPYNVAVGGTDFNDYLNPQNYWNANNDPTTGASAKSYIPELTWNDSCTNSILANLGWSKNPETNCNDSRLNSIVWTVAGSGGASSCTSSSQTVGSCTAKYAKPSWQVGPGVPNDGARDLPDVSLFASNGFLGHFYIICQSDSNPYKTCDLNAPYYDFAAYGGTSVASPAFAGIMALVVQSTGSRQGNANYTFYKLAAQQTASSCNSSNGSGSACVFNDVTNGTIAMPCQKNSANCTTANSSHSYGVLSGYGTGTAYDLATGLGSVNAANLVSEWNSVTLTPSTTALNGLSPVTITHGQPVSISVAVAPQSGTGTPSGTVSLVGGPNDPGLSFDSHALTSGMASWTSSLLPGGTYNVTAHYPGDGVFAASDSGPTSVTVNKENSNVAVKLVTFDFNGHLVSSNAATAPYGSPYLLRVSVTGTTCSSNANGQSGCPTGTVTLTDNSASLDAGTYTLNNLGYAEDQTIQLPGGSHALRASYAGDNSFNAGIANNTITITPAQTFMDPALDTPGFVFVGSSFSVRAHLVASSFGDPPTGAFTFLLDNKAYTGQVSYDPTPDCGNDETVCLDAAITTSFSSPGVHTIAASFDGDTNYGASGSVSTQLSAYYATTMTLIATPANPQAGASVTLTAVVDTPAKNLTPTGTVVFKTYSTSAVVPGTVTYTPVTDASGNSALQATLSFVPTSNNMQLVADYSGDSNYQGTGSIPLSISVAGSDFAFVAGGSTLTVAPGQSGAVGFGIDGQASYAGTVDFTSSDCAGLPAETTCTFSPTSVTGSGSTTVFVNTTAPHALLRKMSRSASFVWWPASLGGLAGICLLGTASKGRKWSKLLALVVIGFVLVLPSCGGGGGGGGGGGNTDPGTPKGRYTITVTATSGSLTHSASFQLIVQ